MNKLEPFDLTSLLSFSAEQAVAMNLKPVTSTDWFEDKSQTLHPQGLFSAQIFGVYGTPARALQFSFIDIKASILHPQIYKDLCSMSAFYEGVLTGKKMAVFDPKTKDFVPSGEGVGGTGYAFFLQHLPKMKIPQTGTKRRQEMIEVIERSLASGVHTTTAVAVVPAAMRELDLSEAHPQADAINDLYYKLIVTARTIDPSAYKVDPSLYDVQSMSLQRTFCEIYDYIIGILNGKRGWMNAKFYSRAVQMGTRNVITAMPIYTPDATSNELTNQHTTIGLFQFLQATLPKSVFHIKDKIVSGHLDDYEIPSLVTDVKTKKAVRVRLTQNQFDRYASKEGLIKLINYYAHRENREKVAMVTDKHCLCLIYDDGSRMRLLDDISDLPSGFDAKHVRPITYTEMLTYCVYHSSIGLPVVPARYPIASEGSTYTSLVYLMIYSDYAPRTLLGADWSETDTVYDRWPTLGGSAFDSMSLHPTRLAKADADHDGDMSNCNVQLTSEAIAETHSKLKDKAYYFTPNNTPIWSADTKTTGFVMAVLTAD